MPELTTDELSGFLAWVVDAIEFIPLSDPAKKAVDQLIEWQQQQNQKQAPEPKRVFVCLALPDKYFTEEVTAD